MLGWSGGGCLKSSQGATYCTTSPDTWRALKVLAELPLPLHAENVEVERRRADTVNGAVVDGDACLRPFFVVLLFQNEKVQKEKLQAIGRWWFFTPFCFTKTSDRFPPI